VAAKPFVGDRIVLNHHHNYEEMTRVLEETNQQCHGNICSVNGAWKVKNCCYSKLSLIKICYNFLKSLH